MHLLYIYRDNMSGIPCLITLQFLMKGNNTFYVYNYVWTYVTPSIRMLPVILLANSFLCNHNVQQLQISNLYSWWAFPHCSFLSIHKRLINSSIFRECILHYFFLLFIYNVVIDIQHVLCVTTSIILLKRVLRFKYD